MSRFLGILREPVYSPGKVDDDRAILEGVATALTVRHEVRVMSATDSLPNVPDADVVFTMAQGPAALATMRQWQACGVRVVNTATAIENCHRHRMTAAFCAAQVRQPPTALVRTHAPAALPAWIADGVWIKRGDVHATQPDDVVFADDAGNVAAALSSFDRRGISTAIIQRHVPGTVIKFYAVRGRYFTWLWSGDRVVGPSVARMEGAGPSAPKTGHVHGAHGPSAEGFGPQAGGAPSNRSSNAPTTDRTGELPSATVAAIRALAERGAAALGVEVFGGDCVLPPDGAPLLIDLNDWPSYGPCRLEAAHAIARYVATPTR